MLERFDPVFTKAGTTCVSKLTVYPIGRYGKLRHKVNGAALPICKTGQHWRNVKGGKGLLLQSV